MVGLCLAMTTIPQLYAYLHTTALPLRVWGGILLAIVVSTSWIEVGKILRASPSRVPNVA
jgi:hypothetical protein